MDGLRRRSALERGADEGGRRSWPWRCASSHGWPGRPSAGAAVAGWKGWCEHGRWERDEMRWGREEGGAAMVGGARGRWGLHPAVDERTWRRDVWELARNFSLVNLATTTSAGTWRPSLPGRLHLQVSLLHWIWAELANFLLQFRHRLTVLSLQLPNYKFRLSWLVQLNSREG
jgi:hypothetical protein